MKKICTIFGVFFSICVIVSAATAVPLKTSEPALTIINNLETKNIILDHELGNFSERSTEEIVEIISQGILVDLLIALISFINSLVQLILSIMQFGDLILSLIQAITSLFNVVLQFIDWIQGLLNPSLI
jgi:hypothetical protein